MLGGFFFYPAMSSSLKQATQGHNGNGLSSKSLWLRIENSLLVLSTKEGAAENPSGSLGLLASLLSDVTYKSCHVEYLIVTLTPPSCSTSTSARSSTFKSGKHHKSIYSIKKS